MTIYELKKEVNALGFETEIENEESFICALRRALSTIYTERATLETLKIRHSQKRPVVYIEGPIETGRTIALPQSTKAYSFISSGRGRCILTDERKTRYIDFVGQREEHRGFVVGGGSISFVGDYAFNIYSLSAFETIASQNEEDIPIFDGQITYDMNLLVSDFLAFHEPPKDEHGVYIKNSGITESRLLVPADFGGEVFVTYKKAPRLESTSASTEIPIARECEHLLALLVSAYVWLDDDADKAQYYMSLYRDAMSAVKVYNRKAANSTYHDVLGWA